MNIGSLTSAVGSIPGIGGDSASATGANTFAQTLGSAINNVESAQQAARSAAMDFLAAGKGDVHTIALAAQTAELSLEMFQQVRNKFVSAYQEIMKMPM